MKKHESKTFDVIDSETLMTSNLEPIRFVVENLVAQGLHLLAGAAKIGKSWLVLWLCLQVAKGEKLWEYNTTQGTVLYLCLEDSFVRIQNRLLDITDDAPQNLYFSIMAETLDSGLEIQIENFIAENKNTNLIVIDTLQCIRPVSREANAYANDYRDIRILKAIADKYKIAIILVHHFRKANDDDHMNMISGTTGISGGVDSAFTLAKTKRNEKTAVLKCEGRDIEYHELELEFDKQSHVWNLLKVSDGGMEIQKDNILESVKTFLSSANAFTGTATELANAIEEVTGEKFIYTTLSKKLIQNTDYLESIGINYKNKRSGTKREILLSLVNDGNDSNDGKNDIVPIPNLLSQPSQLSQTTCEPNIAPVCSLIGAGGKFSLC